MKKLIFAILATCVVYITNGQIGQYEYIHLNRTGWPHISFIENGQATARIQGVDGYFSITSTNGGTRHFSVNTSSGNVGIGTISPTHPLTINGGFHSDGAKSIVLERQQTGGAYNNIKASLGISGNTSQGGLRFLLSADDGSTWGDVLFLQAGGNVGIGTPNPNSKLAVDGQIRATEVKVLTDISVPDYVFEPDYQLRTLKETKEYISENKHLPEIPSASEMETDGIDLGDMNMRLLKKIEELTLYQIELLE